MSSWPECRTRESRSLSKVLAYSALVIEGSDPGLIPEESLAEAISAAQAIADEPVTSATEARNWGDELLTPLAAFPSAQGRDAEQEHFTSTRPAGVSSSDLDNRLTPAASQVATAQGAQGGYGRSTQVSWESRESGPTATDANSRPCARSTPIALPQCRSAPRMAAGRAMPGAANAT